MPACKQWQIAVIADAHFHDLEGDYGIPAGSETRLTARSWADTRGSTRVFNESFAAFHAALEETARRGIRHVVLLGDYSDDGQITTLSGVAALLDRFALQFDMAFYALPGNHDGFATHGRHHSKRLVTAEGHAFLVSSDLQKASADPLIIHHEGMACPGYPEALMPLARHGLMRSETYHHWETPFGPSDDFAKRRYRLTSRDGKNTAWLTDSSYLVEPEDGLWLLMIDANVFEPRDGAVDLSTESGFIDSTGAGWNAVIRLRPYLIDWIASVHERAARLNKTLLCFSHYPVLDVFGDNLEAERQLFGHTSVVQRTPSDTVAEVLARAGMRHHFSGHIHVNGVTEKQTDAGTLSNIAVPSLVAFPPGLRVVSAASDRSHMETVSLADLPVDSRLMQFYRAETVRNGEPPHAAFNAEHYGTFLYQHLEALVSHRFLPREWPAEMAALVAGETLDGLLVKLDVPASHIATMARDAQLEVPMLDVITDWYALRQAQELALPFIPEQRIMIYRSLVGLAAHDLGSGSAQRFFKTFFQVLGTSLARVDAALADLRPQVPTRP